MAGAQQVGGTLQPGGATGGPYYTPVGSRPTRLADRQKEPASTDPPPSHLADGRKPVLLVMSQPTTAQRICKKIMDVLDTHGGTEVLVAAGFRVSSSR